MSTHYVDLFDGETFFGSAVRQPGGWMLRKRGEEKFAVKYWPTLEALIGDRNLTVVELPHRFGTAKWTGD